MFFNRKRDTAFIYALVNPSTDKIFYIGATIDPYSRLMSHIYTKDWGGTKKQVLIHNLVTQEIEPELLVLDECHISKADFWESFYMDLYSSWGYELLQNKCIPYSTVESRNFLPDKHKENPKYNTPTHIDGKDIHHYRRLVFKHFNFFEHNKYQ